MEMKNPAHPGCIIKSEIEGMGLSVAKAAEGLGVTRQQLHRVIRGDSAVSADMAWRLEKAIGSTAEFWLRMQLYYELAQIRNRKPQPTVRKLMATDKAA